MARMPDFEREIAREWDKIVHRQPEPQSLAAQLDAARAFSTQPPASQPVTLTADATTTTALTPEETLMSLLTTLTEDARGDLTDGLSYAEGLIARLKDIAPSVIETADTIGGSTVGKLIDAAAGAVLPAPAEEILVNLVKDFVSHYGTPAPATTATPVAPVATAPAAPAPAEAVAQPVQ